MEPPKPPPRPGPALGAVDGVRKDLQAAKQAALEALKTGKDPSKIDHNAFGSAWTHDFLNKKPWHPMNFKNQARVWEAEQQHYEKEKRVYDSRKEFEAEQAYLKTISMLDPEEQAKYKERQSVAWLYMKPPGFNDAQVPQIEGTADGNKNNTAKDAAAPVDQGGLIASNEAAAKGDPSQLATSIPQQQQQSHQNSLVDNKDTRSHSNKQQRGRNYVSKVIGGFKAVVQKSRLQLKGEGRRAGSPPRGGFDVDAPNQRYVVADMDSDQEEEVFKLALMSDEERQRLKTEAARKKREALKAAEQAKLEEAKRFLKAAGIPVPEDSSDSGDDTDSNSSSGDEEQREGSHKRKRKGKRRKHSSKKNKIRDKDR